MTRPRWSAGRLALVAALSGLVVTAVVVLVPDVPFARRGPAVHLLFETAEAVVGAVVAFLALQRFRETQRARELWLAAGLAVLAVANLLLAAVPGALSPDGGAERWTPLLVRLLGTLLLAVAALLPVARTVPGRQVLPRVVGAALLVVVLALVGRLLGDVLPTPDAPDAQDGRVLLGPGHPLVLVTQVTAGLLYGVASAAFARRSAEDPRDELLRWLAPAFAVAAVARVGYLLFPSLYSDYVSVGDALRLAGYLLLLVGAACEVRSYWARAAVQEDRRRLARDLHDGLSQELAYIQAQSRLLLTRPDPDVATRIASAAARALDEARGAIHALTGPEGEDVAALLERTLEDLARRYDCALVLDLDDEAAPGAERTEALLRIAAEALRNAAEHGRASSVAITLTAVPLVLRVRDDGAGFDPVRSASSGFGLTSMRERAESTGGALAITSAPGRGTTVEVRWR